jgi:hypothetical protein
LQGGSHADKSGQGFIGDSAVTPHTSYASTRPVWGARVRCMRAVIVVVVVFCFYCVVSYRPSYSLSITRALVVVVVVRFALSAPERACKQARPESALRVLIPLLILPLTDTYALLLFLLAH